MTGKERRDYLLGPGSSLAAHGSLIDRGNFNLCWNVLPQLHGSSETP